MPSQAYCMHIITVRQARGTCAICMYMAVFMARDGCGSMINDDDDDDSNDCMYVKHLVCSIPSLPFIISVCTG